MKLRLLPLIFIGSVCFGCGQERPSSDDQITETAPTIDHDMFVRNFNWNADNELESSSNFDLEIKQTGRYRIEVFGGNQNNYVTWIEDYIDNSDNRTYNITGDVVFDSIGYARKDGIPLAEGLHKLKLHSQGEGNIDSLKFSLMFEHQATKTILTQSMDSGTNWELVWSDEFDTGQIPDTTKWSYNVGNWGWGNKEPQYYTADRVENSRIENGNLIIEAHKNDLDQPWTSARLTTQSKVSFKYGKIEFRAKVPVGRGTWAAGWLLGDSYVDELSWPYCGEIDVLECVGYEIDDSTGHGVNHATCHTRAYYFKQGNQIGSEVELDSMNTKFHTYAVEWYPDVIYGLIDGERYYTYDKNANDLEWPFNTPQNIILNLAVGGGWGGAKGIDDSYVNHQFVLDYVRVYSLK